MKTPETKLAKPKIKPLRKWDKEIVEKFKGGKSLNDIWLSRPFPDHKTMNEIEDIIRRALLRQDF